MEDNYVLATLVPQHFLAPFGLVNVRQTQLDNQVNITIAHLLGIDHSSAIAMLAPVMNLSTRLEMMKNLIPLKLTDIRDRCKLETIRKEVIDLSQERNRLIHDLPSGYSPSKDSISFMRAETLTYPQIRVVPPKHITVKYLHELAEKLLTAQVWLNMRFLPDGYGAKMHPKWLNDDDFPWRDRYDKLLQKVRRAQGWHRLAPHTPPHSSPA